MVRVQLLLISTGRWARAHAERSGRQLSTQNHGRGPAKAELLIQLAQTPMPLRKIAQAAEH
jgi:hypothetical protein